MEGGDISNEVSPRLLIVWENLLGLLPTKTHEAKVGAYLRFKRYSRAVDVYVLNKTLADRIWDVTWRLKYSVDLITWLGPDFATALRERIDNEDLPIAHITAENPDQFARKLAYLPHVAAIYDPDPRHRFTFGSRGRIISPTSPDLVGAF